MKCISCGYELKEGETLCPYCHTNNKMSSQINQGQNIFNNQQNQYNNQVPNQMQNQDNYNYTPQNNNNNKKPTMSSIIGFIIMIIVLIVVIFLLFFNGKDSSDNAETNKDLNTQNDYIIESRKSSYVLTANDYIYLIMNKVNEAKDFRLFSTNTLYMIPVGNDKKNSCAILESGGKSPFSDKWNFAYVGVTYNGYGYKYYFIGEDGSGQGISMLDKKTLFDKGTNYLYNEYAKTPQVTAPNTKTMTKTLATKLSNLYNDSQKGNTKFDYCDKNESNCTKTTDIDEDIILVDTVKQSENDKKISNIIYIGSCSL